MLLVSAYIGNLDLIPHGSFGRDPPILYTAYTVDGINYTVMDVGCDTHFARFFNNSSTLDGNIKNKKQKTEKNLE